MYSKSITMALDVSELEPLDSVDTTDLYRVYLSHPKVEGRLEIVGTLSTLKVMIESLAREASDKPKGSVEGILASIKELVTITRSIKHGS